MYREEIEIKLFETKIVKLASINTNNIINVLSVVSEPVILRLNKFKYLKSRLPLAFVVAGA